ncbi:MAG TPA: TonB-dependent receptor, partial [Blastocatellia bacterium]|nr:TonB-dependent receptor [Blastocatellia bacterium]
MLVSPFALKIHCVFAAVFIWLAMVSPVNGRTTAQTRVSGTLVDQNGGAISNAEITLEGAAYKRTVSTDAHGGFVFDGVPVRSGVITIQATGFASITREWSAGAADAVDLGPIALAAAVVAEQVTVTATRTQSRVSDSAQSIAVLTAADLKDTPALNLDDALKQIQGFSLFRRSSSRTSNPTTQGVSLRGIGASGASRALVLDDGIPLDDPFGGWVYWDRIPKEAIGRVEVLQGGASSLYGTDPLSGVVNVIREDNHQSALSLETSYGNENTPEGSLFATGRTGNWIGSIAGEAMNTDGYIIVDKSQRGRVDTPAGGDHSSLEGTVERLFGDRGSVFLRTSTFGEARENGTPVQTNRTHQRELDAGLDLRSLTAGSFSARFFGSTEVFDQRFSAVFTGRNAEALTNSQRVPSQQIGVSGLWTRTFGSRQTAVAGFDERDIHGSSDELQFSSGKISSAVGAGGRERLTGVFGEDIIRITPTWLLTIGGRFDHWSNYDALSATTPLATPGPRTVKDFPDRTESAFSPKLSLLHRVSGRLTIAASVYRAFRAPTLNELYRNFRVGNIITDANSDLKAERLTGYEGGATVTGFNQRLTLRGTFFWNDVDRAIANVTTAFITPIT